MGVLMGVVGVVLVPDDSFKKLEPTEFCKLVVLLSNATESFDKQTL